MRGGGLTLQKRKKNSGEVGMNPIFYQLLVLKASLTFMKHSIKLISFFMKPFLNTNINFLKEIYASIYISFQMYLM